MDIQKTQRSMLQRTVLALVKIGASLLAAGTVAHGATTASQYGITWTWVEDRQIGQYATGDYWVVGPITITSITPASVVVPSRSTTQSTTVSNSVINGSMVNPIAGTAAKQGFDSDMNGDPAMWDATLNVARPGGNNLSGANPLVLAAGSSLISTISAPLAYARPALTDAAILTVVSAPPAANSFRPPYDGTDKSFSKTTADIDYNLLLSLPQVSGVTALSVIEANMQRPWIEINTSHAGWFFHPTNNQGSSGYGRDLAFMTGDALLSLHLNYTRAQKATLVTRMIQYGIDIYGAAASGGVWEANGGHNHGRKMPMLLAGLLLHDANIVAWADASQHFIFQEDQQTWIVTQADVGRALVDETSIGRIHTPYIQADVGLAEWGEKHFGTPSRDGRNWDAFYRDQVGGTMIAHILAARLTKGAVAAWQWDPLMAYIDRHYATEVSLYGFAGAHYTNFYKNMWQKYRAVADGPVSAPSTLRTVP